MLRLNFDTFTTVATSTQTVTMVTMHILTTMITVTAAIGIVVMEISTMLKMLPEEPEVTVVKLVVGMIFGLLVIKKEFCNSRPD